MTIYEFMADNTMLTIVLSIIGAITTYGTCTGCAECLGKHNG